MLIKTFITAASLLGVFVYQAPAQTKGANMDATKQTALKVQRSLDKYVVIHDALFGADSWLQAARKTIEPMDFPRYAKELGAIRTDLSGCLRQIKQHGPQSTPVARESTRSLSSYTEALLATVTILEGMLTKLARKSKEPDFYPAAEYKADIQRYAASVDTYSSAGKELNAVFRKLP